MDWVSIFEPQNYFFNPYGTSFLFVASLVFLLGMFIASVEEKTPFNRSLPFLCLFISLWLYGQYLLLSSSSEQTATFWAMVSSFGYILSSVALLHVSLAFSDRNFQFNRLIIFTYMASLGFVVFRYFKIFPLTFRKYPWGFYPEPGSWYQPTLIFVLVVSLAAIVNLINYYRHQTNSLEKTRTRTLMLAFLFVLLGHSDTLIGYDVVNFLFSDVALVCFVVCMVYSIITHHYLTLDRYTRRLETQVEEKTKEISKVVDELKATQIRLIESGKTSAIASLSAGILHQISQPITAIQGFAKFMRKEMKESDPFYKPVKLMEEQSAYLKEMLEDLMDLIRHREIKKDYIDINVCIKKATDLLTDELRIRRVNWDVSFAEDIPQIYADSVHLQQVFMNIIVNALQALGTLPKGVQRNLMISTEFDKSSNKVIVILADSGPGLSANDKHQIFEPFFSTKTKGSGIGLALCKDLIAEHGGTIGVESELGAGAKFIITFPPADSVRKT